MNNTLKNGLQLLEFLAATPGSLSIRDIAEKFSLPDSHVHRLLATMKEAGYVEQVSPGRRYRGSLKLLTLSQVCLQRLDIRSRVRPYLDELARKLNSTTFLMLPCREGALIVDTVYPGGVQGDAGLTIGAVNPPHASAGGKVCCAHVAREELEELLAGVELEKYTERTITERTAFEAELERVRAQGYAITDAERGANSRAAAAPIFDCDGNFAAALGVALGTEAATEKAEKLGEVAAECVRAAKLASFALGYGRANAK